MIGFPLQSRMRTRGEIGRFRDEFRTPSERKPAGPVTAPAEGPHDSIVRGVACVGFGLCSAAEAVAFGMIPPRPIPVMTRGT